MDETLKRIVSALDAELRTNEVPDYPGALFTAVSADEGNKAIDYAGFAKLTRELNGVRQSRRISEEKFFEHSGRAEDVILDL